MPDVQITTPVFTSIKQLQVIVSFKNKLTLGNLVAITGQAEIVGQIEELTVRYYAISAERKLRHPAVIAISESAQHDLFN